MSEKDISREIKRLEKLMLEHACAQPGVRAGSAVRDQLTKLRSRPLGPEAIPITA